MLQLNSRPSRSGTVSVAVQPLVRQWSSSLPKHREAYSAILTELTKNHEELSNICSSYENENKRFQSDEWDLTDIPFLKRAQANIFCEVDQLISYHTHSIVFGKVLKSSNSDDINTLTYVDGRYE